MEQPKKRRFVNRIIFTLVLVGGYILVGQLAKPFMPHIQLPAEPLTAEPLFNIFGQDVYFTNTMTSTVLAYILVILLAFAIRRQIKKGKQVLTGIPGAFAAILEGFYGMTENTAGKWAKKIFPYFATIFLLVLMVNLMELLPGVETIGILRPAEHGHGYLVEKVGPFNTIREVEEHAEEGEVMEDAAHEGAAVVEEGETLEEEHGEEVAMYSFFPFLRVASTDLNFTLSIAIISVVMTQVIGFRALGLGYLTKYFNFKGVWKAQLKPQFGNPMDFIIAIFEWIASLLEIIAEFAKIISFTFRLFGVIFAGSVLLFFIGSFVGAIGQMGVLFLELLFGPLQAFVFGMLTMVFMSLATHSHGPDAEHAH